MLYTHSSIILERNIRKYSCKEKNNPDPVTSDNVEMEPESSGFQEMTASYSEISFDSESSPLASGSRSPVHCPDSSTNECDGQISQNAPHISSIRPDCLNLRSNDSHLFSSNNSNIHHKAAGYLQSQGTVMKDGDLVLFVAEDLEKKIKLSSPIAKKGNILYSTDSKNSASYVSKAAHNPQLPVLDSSILNELENEARRVATSVDSITENISAILHSASALTLGCLETYRDAVCRTCDTIDFNIKLMYQLMAKCEELSKSMAIIHTKADKIKDMKKMLELFENTMI